jgi:hypothetical protein
LDQKGKLDHLSLYAGKHSHVVIPDAFEIEFHTHPSDKAFVELPSLRDLKVAMNRKLKVGDFRGEMSITVGKHGVVFYHYTKNVPFKNWNLIQTILERGVDSLAGLRVQIDQINETPFNLKMYSWDELKRDKENGGKGIQFKVCFQRYVVDP